jgi:uncharacterized protein YbjT (DUF2867 family)
MATIVLTGATGNLGSAVLKHLLTLVPPSRIIVSVYNPSGHDAIAATGVTVRRGDYTDPDSLDRAYAGADKLLIVSSPSFDDELRILSHRNAIEAAKRQGIKRIVYTSLAFGDNCTAQVMQAHLATEDILKASGVPYTIIREGVYIESWPLFTGFYAPGVSELVIAGDGGVAWADRDDLAEGTAKVLAGDEFENQTITFTGSKAYNMLETVAIVSSIIGKEINLRVVSEEEYHRYHADKAGVIKFWVSTYPWLETGGVAVVDPLLEKLLGRPLVGLEGKLRELLSVEQTAEISNWVENGLRQ